MGSDHHIPLFTSKCLSYSFINIQGFFFFFLQCTQKILEVQIQMKMAGPKTIKNKLKNKNI